MIGSALLWFKSAPAALAFSSPSLAEIDNLTWLGDQDEQGEWPAVHCGQRHDPSCSFNSIRHFEATSVIPT
jgi:hypothetical protein